MPLVEVYIDKAVLSAFKTRALRSFPIERVELLWGEIEDSTAFVHVMTPVFVEDASSEGISFDSDDDYGDQVGDLTLLGSIHTHPEGVCGPSEDDIEDAKKEKEIIYGICAIRKGPKRRHVSYCFYDTDSKQLELIVSENER